MGMKVSDALIVALCQTCHTAMDQGSEFTKQERTDMFNECYVKQMQHLVEAGHIHA